MTPDILLFLILALVAVASALGMLFSQNAIYSALNLILNFGAVAVLYLVLDAPFIALAQVTVYAGAIMVLFLFVIMLLGAERLRQGATLPYQQPASIILAVILMAMAVYALLFRSPAAQVASSAVPGFGDPASLAMVLFNEYLLPFEVTSILLLVAIIGAIVLTHKRVRQPRP
jgi:NADH-quinone oxidoreductase subunit J